MKPRWLNLPFAILCLVGAMLVSGMLMHGVRWETLARGWHNVLARPGEMMGLRFILQPTMAVTLAIRDGIRDARAGNRPFVLALITDPAGRRVRLQEAVGAIGTVMLAAIAIDIVYEIVRFGVLYPVEALVVGLVLAVVPYLLVRGPAARVSGWWFQRRTAHMGGDAGSQV